MGGNMTLGDIIPNASFNPDGGNHIILFEAGMIVAKLTYMDADQVGWYKDDNGVELPVGWYDQSKFMNWSGLTPSDNMNSYVLPFGMCIMLNAGTGQGVVFCGEVKADATEVVYSLGSDLYGNCTPVEMDLGDIIPNASFNPDGGNHIILFEAGMIVAKLTYMDADQVGWYKDDNGVELPVGWYDQSKFMNWSGLTPSDNMNSYVFGPGVGFMLNAGTGQGVVVPSAL